MFSVVIQRLRIVLLLTRLSAICFANFVSLINVQQALKTSCLAFDQLPDPPIPYNALLPEENGVLNMEVVEDAPEVSEAELQEVADAIDDIPQEDENGDASNANEVTENEVTENEATENEPAENENGDVEMPEQAEVPPPPPPFRTERLPDE